MPKEGLIDEAISEEEGYSCPLATRDINEMEED